ncbi:MAG: hypothetical protein JWM78_1212 [Verrucomicrobiaceae bacterium]|nr:hypothetical protein [Verrucomicrobiaceae bacterium]
MFMKLYKFKYIRSESLLHSLDMIVNERIYLSTCEDLNDPSEGAFRARYGEFGTADNEVLTYAYALRKLINSTLFTSFASAFENELLWAHYAGGFTGVCFEYELDEKQLDIRPIQYIGAPEISKKQADLLLAGHVAPQDLNILLTKSHAWVYENEYRLFSTSGSANPYLYAKPSRIIFGFRNQKYDDVFHAIAKKFDITISYLNPLKENYEYFDVS